MFRLMPGMDTYRWKDEPFTGPKASTRVTFKLPRLLRFWLLNTMAKSTSPLVKVYSYSARSLSRYRKSSTAPPSRITVMTRAGTLKA